MFKIDKKTYSLDKNKYINEETLKERIIIGNTYSTDMKHVIGWNNRWFGRYLKTAMFTIGFDGTIYQHFPIENYSNFVDDAYTNKTSISILLENEGWLKKDLFNENLFVNYIGDIYKREQPIIKQKWKTHEYWSPYTEKQFESTIKLVKFLCKKCEIEPNVMSHNTFMKDIEYFGGVIYKSNFKQCFNDVNPGWDFKGFKNKVELN